MTDDVVAELDAWLSAWEGPDDYRLTVNRARIEIVALRVERDRLGQFVDGVKHHVAQARAEALEEAVRAIDQISWDWPSPWIDDAEAFKAAIRKLKEKRDE